MKKFINFPDDFWWGAATSGPQSEGTFEKPHENIMDYWFRTEPEDFFNGVGPNIASDFYHHYENDFKLMGEIAFNSFRTSIQWSRLIKDFETGEVDLKAVEFYNKVIDSAKKNNVKLVLNLHHFDMPIELLKKYGGWESKYVVELFVKFARVAFEHFGDKVEYWTTFNEPMVIPEAGYLYGQHYPKYSGKGLEAMQVIYNINLASAKVIEEYRKMKLKGKIGIIMNLTPSYPRSDSKEDLLASKFADDLFNRSFLDPATKGTFPENLVKVLTEDKVIWNSSEDEIKIIADNTVDFIGVNYYHPKRVKSNESAKDYSDNWMPDKYFENYEMPGRRMNPYRGWEIYPRAIYDIAINIKENYGNIPWFISENGMGVEGEENYIDKNGEIQDDYRIEFYEEHLAWLSKAINEGCNCFGYHTWTAFDCWSWNNAYKNRYGFIAIDLETQKRTIKKSGYWYKEVSTNNGFYYDSEKLI
ncbi:glycoside hydrolase family 1 protein [Peptostreptococcus russellii]|uniref:glycoside hydrolase family 1 protein n=1 Tax=Peptostreptococcus russellii TaxID=215200 RepID=UPI0026EBCF4D|nr:glycoside hydrolase family 1 protein [Peptostreptococcus russellii]